MLGQQVKVLEPPFLMEEVKQYLKEALTIYS